METVPDAFGDLARVADNDARFFLAEPGLKRRVLAHNQRLMLVENHMELGWAGARHSHPHEQLVYVQRGSLRFSVGTVEFAVKAGDSFVIKGGVEHQAWALEPSVVLDVFTPFRADYLPKEKP